MEVFRVYRGDIQVEEASKPGAEMPQGFRLLILRLEEWNEVSQWFPEPVQEHQVWLERLRDRETQESKTRQKEGALVFRPHIDRLSLNVHYVCFRDVDDQGHERPIRLFLTSNVFILIEWNGITLERLKGWAHRGILNTPMDLACIFGLRVLRHHQKRLENIEDQMDFLEEEILMGPRSWQQTRIISLHRRILGLKKSLNAHLSVFTRLKSVEKRSDGDLQEELMSETQRAIDNVRQTHELIENLREAYQAAVDNRANDIMKLLTLLATILLPINLLTSFFGMNFEQMPLIHATYGINVFYAASLIIVIVGVTYFWKKKWLK